MKKKESNIATGLDPTPKKRAAQIRRIRKILKERYSAPGSIDYHEYMIDRFLELGGDYDVYHAIADYWNILNELNGHYKRNKKFANALNNIIEAGSDFGGTVDAGTRLEALFKFFDAFNHRGFSNLIEMKRLDVYPNQFTLDDLEWLEESAYDMTINQ